MSLHNLSKEMESINQTSKDKTGIMDDSKGSLFITAEEKSDYSTLLHGANKKKNKASINTDELNMTAKSKQGLLPRIKQNVNSEMIKEL